MNCLEFQNPKSWQL